MRSQSSLIFNVRVGYKFDNGPRFQLDVLHLFNAKTNQIEYCYLSRLPGELIGGVFDRHVHMAEPLALRLTLAGRFRTIQRLAVTTRLAARRFARSARICFLSHILATVIRVNWSIQRGVLPFRLGYLFAKVFSGGKTFFQ